LGEKVTLDPLPKGVPVRGAPTYQLIGRFSAEVAVSVSVSPIHTDAGLGEMRSVSGVCMRIVIVSRSIHPPRYMIVAMYDADWVTVIVGDIAWERGFGGKEGGGVAPPVAVQITEAISLGGTESRAVRYNLSRVPRHTNVSRVTTVSPGPRTTAM
jgi:hypothetical protein